MSDPKIRDEERSYDPSTPEANRSIEQGNGVGARDLDRQASPTRDAEPSPSEEEAPEPGEETQDLPTPLGENDFV